MYIDTFVKKDSKVVHNTCFMSLFSAEQKCISTVLHEKLLKNINVKNNICSQQHNSLMYLPEDVEYMYYVQRGRTQELNHFSKVKGEASPSIYADWVNGG